MFAYSLLDYHWANRSRRGWMTLVAFALQALGISLLLLLPLIYTQGLPRLQKLEALGAPAPPPAPARMRPEKAAQSNMIGERLLTPSRIPRVITSINETTPPPPIDPGGSGILGSTGNSASKQFSNRFNRKFDRCSCASSTGDSSPPAAHLACDGGKPYLQGSAGVPACCEGSPDSRPGRTQGSH
jgi:hypothetical protein